MGVLKGLVTAGIAQRVIAEARKPANQAKAKRLVRQLQDKAQRPAR